MIRCSFQTSSRRRVRLDHLLLASGIALVLSTLPVSMGIDGPPLSWQVALAKGGHGGDDRGGGNGGGRGRGGGRGDRGQDVSERSGGPGSRGLGRGQGGDNAGASGYHDLDEFVDSVRSGRALGIERRDQRIAKARDRYQKALGEASHGSRAGHGLSSDEEIGRAVHRFSPEETKALMARGWKGPDARTAGFRNHGERVRTMVELSKRLGYGARVGAMQASFGTPYENQIAALQADIAEARAAGDEAEVEHLEADLAKAIENAKPGNGPDDSWATADLDVNDDGVVDLRDLEALDEADRDAGASDESAG